MVDRYSSLGKDYGTTTAGWSTSGGGWGSSGWGTAGALGGMGTMGTSASPAWGHAPSGFVTTPRKSLPRYTTRGGPKLRPTLLPSSYLPNNFKEFAKSVKLYDFVKPKEEIPIIRTSDSICDAFSTLIDNKITCCPLLDVTNNDYLAFVTLMDIISYMVDVYQFQTADRTEQRIEDAIMNERFRNTPVHCLGVRGWRAPWVTISCNSTMQDAIDMFTRFRTDMLAVHDNEGNFLSTLSQFQLTEWLAHRNNEQLGELGNQTVQSLRLGFQRVIRLHRSRQVLHAFIRMDDAGVSGVAVTDDNNRVIGNISASDLKDIGSGAENFRKLYMDCGSFIDQRDQASGVPRLIYVHRENNLRDVLDCFKQFHVHRVYIVTREDFLPIGVITDGDIISSFALYHTGGYSNFGTAGSAGGRA